MFTVNPLDNSKNRWTKTLTAGPKQNPPESRTDRRSEPLTACSPFLSLVIAAAPPPVSGGGGGPSSETASLSFLSLFPSSLSLSATAERNHRRKRGKKGGGTC
ncbi:hypothetical protein Hanom_Chr07g00661211 [Helianthus anomalus]